MGPKGMNEGTPAWVTWAKRRIRVLLILVGILTEELADTQEALRKEQEALRKERERHGVTRDTAERRRLLLRRYSDFS